MTVYGIILSGGSGTRLGAGLPKQFLLLDGKPVIVYSAETFSQYAAIASIVYVANPEYLLKTAEILADTLRPGDRIVPGGKTRHDSFLNSISDLTFGDDDIFLIHDAARPFVTRGDLERVIAAAHHSGIATLAEKVTETIVMAEEGKVKLIRDRDKKYLIKTPQAIRGKELKQLLAMDKAGEPTDLCSWAIIGGMETEVVECNPYNIKITLPEDMEKAAMFLPLFERIDS